MKENTFFKRSLLIIVTSLLAVGLVDFWIDPIFYYRKPSTLNLVPNQQMYQNYGAAEHCEYDTAIIGSSTALNFRPEWFDETYGGSTIQLSMSGGLSHEIDLLLESIFLSDNDVKRVFIMMDLFTLTTLQTDSQFTYSEFQFSDNPLLDTNYLLNKDFFLDYTLESLLSRKHYDSYNEMFYEEYSEDKNPAQYGLDAILNTYEREPISEEDSSNIFEEAVNQNCSTFEEYAQKYPNTEFYFIFMPPNMFYYDRMIRDGHSNSYRESLEVFCKDILDLPNTHLYNYLGDIEIITGFDNYRDWVHHKSTVDRTIFTQMNSHELSLENYLDEIDKTWAFISSYNYEALFDKKGEGV